MATSRFRDPSTGKVISFEHAEGLSGSELRNLAQSKYIDALNEDDSFVVDVMKGLGSGGVKAIIDAGSGIQSAGAQALSSMGAENAFVDSLLDNAEYLRGISEGVDEAIGLDQDFASSLGGQIAQGFGQMPVQIAATLTGTVAGGLVGGPVGAVAGALAAGGGFSAGQMQTEAVRDAENTLRKKYRDFSEEEKKQTAASSLSYMAIGGALEYFALSKVVPAPLRKKVRNFVAGKGELPSGEIKQIAKSLKREAAEGALFEGMTEAAQGQVLDALANATYDDDRELISMEVLGQRFNEFTVGAVVGGGTTAAIRTGSNIVGGQPLGQPKETPPQDEGSVAGKKPFAVRYERTTKDGGTSEVNEIIYADSMEDAQAQANELLSKDNAVLNQTLTVTSAPTPMDAAPTPEPEVAPEPEVTPEPEDKIRFHGNKSDKELDKIINGTAIEDTEEKIRRLRKVIEETDADDSWLPNAREKTIKELEVELPLQLERAKRARERAIKEKQGRVDGSLNQMTDDEFVNQVPEKEAPAPTPEPTPEPTPTPTAEPVTEFEFTKSEGKPDPKYIGGAVVEYANDFSRAVRISPKSKVFKSVRARLKKQYNLTDSQLDDLRKKANQKLREQNRAGRPLSLDMTTELPSPAPAPAPTPTKQPVILTQEDFEDPPTEQPVILTQEDFEDPPTVGAATEDEPVDSKTGEEASDGKITTLSKNAVEAVVGAPQIKTTRPQPLSDVTPADIIDIEALVEDIVENDIPVWFWYADQLGRGDFTLPNTGETIQMDAGPSFALKPANRADKKIWATGKSAKEINKKIALLKYIDKDGNEQTGYIFIVSGAPKSMHLFNVNVVRAFLRNAFGDKSFSEVKEKMLGLKPTKDIRQVLEDYDSFDAILESPDRKKFVDGLIAQGAKKKTPLKEYLESVGFFNIDPSDLIDGFFRANEFKINDVLLVLKPSYAVDGQNDHSTYSNTVYGDVEGVPDKNVDAYLLMPESVRKEKPITLEPAKAAQVISPYGIHGVRKIQKLDPTQEAERKASVGAAQQPTPGQNAQLGDAVTSAETLAEKIGAKVQARNDISRDAQYNYETRTIEYNPELLARRGPEGAKAAMREEIIHASMHKVLMDRAKGKTPRKAFEDFFNSVGKSMTPEQRSMMQEVYGSELDDLGNGAEYTRFLVQSALDGRTTEETMTTGPAFSKVQALIKSVQNYAARVFGKDLEQNREAAFVIADTIKLLRSFNPEARPANQKIVSDALAMASGLDGLSSENISDPFIGTFEERTKKEKKARRKRALRKFLQPASDFFASVHPEIAALISRYMTGMEAAQFRAAAMVQDFQKGVAGIRNKGDGDKLARLLSYSPDPESITEGEHQDNIRQRDELLLKYDLYNKYKLQVRPLLDQVYSEATDAGLDVNYLQEYFPRKIKDFVGLMNLYGKDVNEDFLDYIEQENQRRTESGEKLLIPSDYPTEFDNYLNQKKFVQPSRIPANLKERRTNMISKEAQPFYYEPEVALSAYLNNIIVAIETQKLLGNAISTKKKPVVIDGETVKALNLNDPTGSLNQLVGRLIAEGKINKEQMQNLEYGLVQFFNPQGASEANIFELGRTFSYGTLLVEPTSTLSQMYDMAFTMLDNGILPSIGALVGRKGIKMRDLGLDPDRLSAEYPAGESGKRKFFNDLVRRGLTLTGFRRMDQLMKETNLTANYRRFQKLAKLAPNSKQHQKFRKEVEFMVGPDVDNVINDLKLNKPDSPFVRELLVRKLLETQPLNRFEMPLSVSSNPNTRMLYTMKSFVVKQMNLITRRYISVMFNSSLPLSQRATAAKDLIKLLFLFMLVGMPIDFLKDLIAGRDVYPSDYATNSLLRVAGISKYTLYEAQREGIGGAIKNYMTPVGIDQTFNMATDIGNILMDPSSIPDAKAVSYLPFSDLWYYRYGPGIEKQQRQRTRKRKEGVRPGVSEFIESLGL